MLKEETLNQIGRRTYEEPDGELLEVISQGNNTISVLTRIDSDKRRLASSPIDPSNLTVSEISMALNDPHYDWDKPALRGLLKAEKNGKNRKTAKDEIQGEL